MEADLEAAAALRHPSGERREMPPPSPAPDAVPARPQSPRFLFRVRTRWTYLAVLALALAAIVAIAAQSYRAIDRELTELTLSRRAAVARLAAATLSEKFARLVDLSVSLATRVRFRELVAEGKWEEASAILRDVPRNFPFIERLFLTDVEGTLLADVPELPGVRGMNFSERDWYQGVRAAWRPYVSPVYVRAAAPRLEVFAAAAPIRSSSGEVSGILVLQLRTESLLEWIREINIGPEGFMYVVDSAGQVALHSKFPGERKTLNYSQAPIVQRLGRGERGVETAFDPFEQEQSVSAYAPVAGFGWGVVSQQPARAAFAARDRQLRNLLIAYGLMLVFLGCAVYLASRVVLQRRQAEEDRRLKAELERRVGERTAQLENANQELESFSYSVSHDLRAPLRAVDGFARMLEEDHSKKLDGEGRRLLRVVRDSSRRMGQLIDDLLRFSRIARGPIAATSIDMEALVHSALEEIGASTASPRPRVEIGRLPAAWGDPVLIKQVWINLLSNAIKFSNMHDDALIEVNGSSEAREHVYCVKDNGTGFDMRYYDKLFGVFQRLHDPDEYPGTGVGLAIVQRVIARHGGRVWAEGKVGEGASFYFSLPQGATHG